MFKDIVNSGDFGGCLVTFHLGSGLQQRVYIVCATSNDACAPRPQPRMLIPYAQANKTVNIIAGIANMFSYMCALSSEHTVPLVCLHGCRLNLFSQPQKE